MADVRIMKAVEFDKLPAKFRKQYPNVQALQEAGWLVQPKYDGCFGMAVIRFDGNSQMLSRTGEDYTTSCKHILDDLYEAACLQSTTWGDIGDFVVLGEVWCERRKFPEISGTFRRRTQSDLLFVANDLLSVDLTTPVPYEDRLAALAELLDMGVRHVRLCDTRSTISMPVEQYAGDLVDEGGYDGAILRDPAAGYTVGLVKAGEIVKVKPCISLDLRVVRVIEGEGKHAGRAGALEVQLPNGNTCQVGTGLTDDDRLKWWAAWLSTGWQKTTPGAQTIIEVEAMGYTADGLLREPRFKGIRFDKTEPDE